MRSFALFRCARLAAGSLEFSLFKLAGEYSLETELNWCDTAAGRRRLGGLLWPINRVQASEKEIAAAGVRLGDFIRTCLPGGVTGSRLGESAFWLRSVAINTPWEEWSGLESSAPQLKSDLEFYWNNYGRVSALAGPEATQLSNLLGPRGADGIEKLESVVRKIGAHEMSKLEASRAGVAAGSSVDLGEVGDWKVEAPLNLAGSSYLGFDTSWCTARPATAKHMFPVYCAPKKGSYLYIFTNRRTGARYQGYFSDGGIEIRDADDVDVSPSLAAQLYKVLQKTGKLPANAPERLHSHLIHLGPLGYKKVNPASVDSAGLPHSEGDAPAVDVGTDTKNYEIDGSAAGTWAWMHHGKLHSENGPAVIKDNYGKDITSIYYQNGVPYREGGGPQYIRSDGNSVKEEKYLNSDGVVHRDISEGPAELFYDDNGHGVGRGYYKDGKLTPGPDGGPAYVNRDLVKWVNDKGEFHRVGGPAISDKDSEQWMENGKKHRELEAGPAITKGNGLVQQYWVNDKRFHKPEKNKSPREFSHPVMGYVYDIDGIRKKMIAAGEFKKYPAGANDRNLSELIDVLGAAISESTMFGRVENDTREEIKELESLVKSDEISELKGNPRARELVSELIMDIRRMVVGI